MSITSLTFVTFILGIFILYYIIPRRFQWMLLLAASIIFYISGGLEGVGYVLVTAATIYFAAVRMQKLSEEQKAYLAAHKGELSKEEKAACRDAVKRRRKHWMQLALVINLGILFFFKYFHFALAQLNGLLQLTGAAGIRDTFRFIVPLGISFYTFQSVGYLVNVYWEKNSAEKNYFKLLLFVSFFPQITQGPISEYGQLSQQLFREHEFRYGNFSWGFQRVIWGFFKKMVIANQLGKYVEILFADYAQYTGLSTLLGAVCYCIHLYADFSGYMDIMCGFCQVLDIKLTENFNRPYFSKSVSEYWRRWHISLGIWFKTYLYFPFITSRLNRRLGKATRARFGKFVSNGCQATLALLVVWLCTGLWHGASWSYVVWGLLNGSIIIFSTWMEPCYTAFRSRFHLHDGIWLWRAFRTLRTFLIMTFVEVLPEVGTLSDGLHFWKHIFTDHRIPHGLGELLPFIDFGWVNDKINLAIIGAGLLTMFVFWLLQRKRPVRERFNALPSVVRWTILTAVMMAVCVFGVRSSWDAGGFLYAGF